MQESRDTTQNFMPPASSPSMTGSVMIWEAISLEGHTDIHILANNTLTAIRYQDEVFRVTVRPYTDAVVTCASVKH